MERRKAQKPDQHQPSGLIPKGSGITGMEVATKGFDYKKRKDLYRGYYPYWKKAELPQI